MTDNIEAILAERQKTHGDYATHAQITQGLKMFMREYRSHIMLTSAQAEALDMIAHKIGRILAGNPDYKDHWVDIAGYAQLVVKELEK